MRPKLTAAAIALFVVALAPAGAWAQGYTPPRTTFGQPDLQGIWKADSRAAYGLVTHHARDGMPAGVGVVQGDEIPYQPWAAAQQRENFIHRATADPLAQCFRPGAPRIMYLDFPFQIVQTPEYVAILFEWSSLYRVVYLNNNETWDGIEFWNGHSRGRWDGDTLVVEVTNHNDRTWFDMAGNFHSNALKVVERYTRVGPDSIRYEVTIEDPKVFTRPWTMRMPFARQVGVNRKFEYQCQAEAEEARGRFVPQPTWYPEPGTNVTPPVTPRPYAAVLPAIRPVPASLPPDVRRMADGKPNLQGTYTGDAVTGSWGLEEPPPTFLFPPGKSLVIDPPDRKLPYLPWARAEQKRRLLPELAHQDPTARCFVAGVPRAMYVLGGPMQLLQTPDTVVMLSERWTHRVIPLDGRPHLPDRVRLWMGDSVGRWEGDTLVVDTTNTNGKSWLSEIGDVISYTAHIVERFTPVSTTRIQYEVTVDDPLVYSLPWTIEVNYTKTEKDAVLLEQACHEGNEAVKLMEGAAAAEPKNKSPR